MNILDFAMIIGSSTKKKKKKKKEKPFSDQLKLYCKALVNRLFKLLYVLSMFIYLIFFLSPTCQSICLTGDKILIGEGKGDHLLLTVW